MLNMSSPPHIQDNKKQVAEKFFIHFGSFPFLLMNFVKIKNPKPKYTQLFKWAQNMSYGAGK
jgi:hypothetical protein